MDIKKLNSRNSALDIIRIVATFFVLSVHFFLHNGFYYQQVEGLPMFIMCLMRTLFSSCVPLFILLTGYLMSKKELSKKYYSGITKTLILFVLVTIACMIYKSIHNHEVYEFVDYIFDTLDFTGANYSWYIEMYIGLFLIAPFLNLGYNKLKNQQQKQILVFTFVAITILPSLFNIFNFDNVGWWADPKSSDEFQKLIPSWWAGFYPVTYYYVGCYLREYGMKLKTNTALITLLISVIVFGSFNYYRSAGTTFKSGIYIYWYGFEPFVLSSLIFLLLSRIKADKMNNTFRFCLWKLSDLTLGIYLISYIFDEVIYKQLNISVPVMVDRLPYYFLCVPLSFILSAASSFILNLLTYGIMWLYKYISNYIKSEINKNKGQFWKDVLFISLMGAGLLFSLWKSNYGFGGNDEAFYLTIPQRILKGDSFLGDEWHLSQLSGFLLIPFVGMYKLIVGSFEGVILAARINYIIIHAIVSSVIYIRLRKYGLLTVFASALFFIFTPYNIMALDYDSMGLDLIALTGVLLGTADYSKKLVLIISGFTFAGAVLCCPYVISAYLLFGICVIIHHILKRNNKNIKFVISENIFSAKTFLWFTIGAVSLAVIFLIVVLSKISISDIFKNLPYLMTDPDHPNLSFGYRTQLYFKSIYNFNKQFKFAVISYGITLLVLIFDKKRKLHRSLYFVISAIFTIYTYALIIPKLTTSDYNSIMFPMLFIGITSYILCNKKPRTLFASLFVLGVIYSVCICFSSNQYFYVISMALASTNLASFVFASVLLKELKETEDNLDYATLLRRASFVSIAFVLVLQTGFQIKCKAEHCFWEFDKISDMTTSIPAGPAKGIYTSQTNMINFNDIQKDLEYYKDKEDGNILFLTEKTWCYLNTDFSFGTLSAWISGENDASINRLKTYYNVNPSKIPQYIYIPKNSNWNFKNIYADAEKFGYNINENTVSYKLEKATK
ncbi:MAG: acyltransferase family protein [Ruminococcus sp.]|nr:acyltransferase family protein [Ruminococcus sp.]